MTSEHLTLKIRQITNEATRINSYELVDPAQGVLPEFTAGSHVDVHIPGDYIRQYSLCNAPWETHRYLITVLDDTHGTGGSKALHREFRAGDCVRVSHPRNNFPIVEEASLHLLLAGGIGVTPFMSMIEHLVEIGADFRMHYCTRSANHTSFRDRLANLVDEGRGQVHFHHDDGDPTKGLDIRELLKHFVPGTHLYYCGPAGFMAAVEKASSHWPPETRHFEYFSPPPSTPTSVGTNSGNHDTFRIKIASTGAEFEIPSDMSIVEVLRANGIEVETSCESGICGTCRTAYLDGTPIHNDYVLTDNEKQQWLMICCARSQSATIVLDL